MKIFIGLTEIAGNYINLKKGFDAIGVSAELVVLNNHVFEYDKYKPNNMMLKIIQYIGDKRYLIRRKNILI